MSCDSAPGSAETTPPQASIQPSDKLLYPRAMQLQVPAVYPTPTHSDSQWTVTSMRSLGNNLGWGTAGLFSFRDPTRPLKKVLWKVKFSKHFLEFSFKSKKNI